MIGHVKDVIKGKAKLFSKRSSKWPSLRKSFLESNDSCAACGCTEFLEVHHIEPFHENPSLELDTNNLITLCDKFGKDNCHLEVGHLGSFKSKNPNVREDAAKSLQKKKKLKNKFHSPIRNSWGRIMNFALGVIVVFVGYYMIKITMFWIGLLVWISNLL